MPKICLGQDGFVNIGQTDDTTTEEMLDFANREGFQGIELHSLFQPYELKSVGSVKKNYSRRNLEIPGLQTGHITFYNNPISADPDERVYSTGWVLFDKNDPTNVLARAQEPIFSPDREWEKVGQVPNVVFVEGLVREGKRWLFYYGGADKHIGVAAAPAR
jgi:hypothetical protein